MRDARDIEVDEHVGARVRSLRLMRGVTQEKLAEMAGVTFQQIQKYEKGVNRLSPSKLATIGEALGVGPEYFFDGLPSGNSAESMTADVRGFIASRDGVALMKAFQLLAPAKRTAIIRLVQAIAARNLCRSASHFVPCRRHREPVRRDAAVQNSKENAPRAPGPRQRTQGIWALEAVHAGQRIRRRTLNQIG